MTWTHLCNPWPVSWNGKVKIWLLDHQWGNWTILAFVCNFVLIWLWQFGASCFLFRKEENILIFSTIFYTVMVQVAVILVRQHFPEQMGLYCRKDLSGWVIMIFQLNQFIDMLLYHIFNVSISPKCSKQHLVIFLDDHGFEFVLDRWLVYCKQVLYKTYVGQSTNPCNIANNTTININLETWVAAWELPTWRNDGQCQNKFLQQWGKYFLLPYTRDKHYRQVSNIRRTSVGSKFVDHSDVVGASPVGAAPTTS